MITISHLLTLRSNQIFKISSQSTVFEALQYFSEHNIGAVMVIDDEKLVGICSERDYTRKIALAGKDSKTTLVKDIMSTEILTASPDTNLNDCMILMSRKKVRHLPIIHGDKVLGMISIRDIMSHTISDHEMTINHLERYISG
jgi:CBS domain-containing protein